MHVDKLVQQFKERRKMLKITQEELAAISGVGLRTIKEIERGEGNPRLSTMQELLQAMGLELCLQVKQTPHEV